MSEKKEKDVEYIFTLEFHQQIFPSCFIQPLQPH